MSERRPNHKIPQRKRGASRISPVNPDVQVEAIKQKLTGSVSYVLGTEHSDTSFEEAKQDTPDQVDF